MKLPKIFTNRQIIILLACFPKSGSTYLSQVIAALDGFVHTGFVPDGERREQEIDEERLKSMRQNCVAQHHVRASRWTISCINKYKMRPIVLVRNIYDCIVSLSDHMVRESVAFPFAYFDETFATLDEQSRLDAIIDLCAPWYFNFYVSWITSYPRSIFRYEDIILGDGSSIASLLRSIGVDVSDAQVSEAAARIGGKEARLNVGVSGRGVKALTQSNIAQIERLASHYQHVDFTSIGIRRH
jgi:hypothetical protein